MFVVYVHYDHFGGVAMEGGLTGLAVMLTQQFSC